MPKVVKLVETISPAIQRHSIEKIKVAAYARVSTGQDAQLNSFEAQKEYYQKLIAARPDWEMVAIYADRGISGTTCEKRPEFTRMIQDCRDGKIQMILTKSVSRFARNTVDSLNTIRELKRLGIGIQFEKENIFTLDSKGEFLITIMSSLSQEESRSISENVKWGIRKRMADGKYSVNFSEFLGYDRGDDGKFIINQTQATIVRAVFRLYLTGYSYTAIASILTDSGIATPAGNRIWHPAVIFDKITNESYKGDKLLQKTYISDFLSKKQKKNHGELHQYYVTAGHEAIIDPVLFDHIQDIRLKRKEGKHQFSGMDPFSNKIVCGLCGNFYGVRPWHKVDLVWQCREKAKKGCRCKNIHIYDYALKIQIRDIMMKQVVKFDALKICKQLVCRMISNESRRKEVLHFLEDLPYRDAEKICSGEDEYLLIIDRITVYPDDSIELRLIDGTTEKYGLRRYTPKMGWYETIESGCAL